MMHYPPKISITAHLVVLLIYLYYLNIRVSSLDTLKQGENLNSTSHLISAKGIFTLGFYTYQETNNSYLAVWFNHIWSNPVWIGNREKPIPVTKSQFLTVGGRGELMIVHNGGEPIMLYGGGSGQNVTATLLDTGNFVVSSAEGEVLWQSFDYPTDTLLPGMKLGVNHRTGRNWTIMSWFSSKNPAPGPFTLEWNPSVSMLIVRRRGVIYWRSGELRDYYNESLGNSSAKEFENFNVRPDPHNFNYNLTSVTSNEEEYFMYSFIPTKLTTNVREAVSGWRLGYIGNMTDEATRSVIVKTSFCYGYNTEGPYARGCELWQQPTCRNDRQTFVFRTGYFTYANGTRGRGTAVSNSSLSPSDCREACWDDCECAGYDANFFGEAGPDCVYWRGKGLVFDQGLEGFASSKYVLQSARRGNKKLVQLILGAVSAVVLIVLTILFFVQRKLKQRKMEKQLHQLLRLEGYTETYELENGGAMNRDLKLFTYASIQSATNYFSSKNKLGEGGFGPVYMGRTPEGHDIAVKLLSRESGQGLLEFKTELILISKLQHVNLVKLIGFCIHGDDKMIIYEYVHNKSLDFFLFSPSMREQLDWHKRFNIIEGTAQGLLYLHKYSRLRIIHRDLKPSNILLDKDMNPKISDFGLARIFKQNASESNTKRRVGTYGYMAPEYAMHGIFSVKSDIYSFGVLVLEIVSGRKNNSFHKIEGPLNLVEYAWELWRKDSAVELMDPTLRDSCIVDELQRCIHIGLLCVENHAVDRPTVEDVISMLKNETSGLPVPKNPAFITRNSVLEQVEEIIPEKLSANEVTITEIGGR